MDQELTDGQRAFIDLLVRRRALRFGDFTLKSGRRSPYFINTGCFHHGGDLAVLGRCYAEVVRRRLGEDVAVVFGPAYKGIPLALATAQAYEALVGRPVGWAFDRKEAKEHGDRGRLVGAPCERGTRVAVVDDVLTAGTALRATIDLLQALGARVMGAVVSVDRQEPGLTATSAAAEIAEEFEVPVHPILTVSQMVDHLLRHDVDGRRQLSEEQAGRIRAQLATG